MKTRDDENALIKNAKEQAIGKTAQACAAHVGQYFGEEQGVRGDALDLKINLGQKTCAKSLRLALAPVLRVDHVQPCGWYEDNGAAQGVFWAASSAFYSDNRVAPSG